MRKPPKGKSLAEVNPELAKEWHPTKNGVLTPFDVTKGSSKKVWWKCDKGEDHEWFTHISSRSKGIGCSVCSNRTIVNSNSLATLNPQLAKEWHPTKNDNLTPIEVGIHSNRKVWWKCVMGEDHVWETSITKRSAGQSCPICSNKKVVNSNCLATVKPHLAKEWHPTKNGDLTPLDFVTGSHKKVWWTCDKGDDHVWKAAIYSRSNGSGCAVCAGQKVVKSNCLAILNPELANEWHPTKNGELTPEDVTIGSNRKVWWKCDKGEDHEWRSTIANRSNGNRCSVCDGKKVVLSNSLAKVNPKLIKEWHPTKNGELTPFEFTINSGKRIWWKCDKGEDHEWKTTIVSRSNGSGCAVCAGQKVVKSNCLAILNPELANEWHPTKNGELTPYDFTVNSHKKVWWKCDKGEDHEWRSIISNRSKKVGCPFCTLTPQSKQELTITFELIQFFDINPKGFKTRVEGTLKSIDIYIKELNLGIEFDGKYWHKDKRDKDKLKTQKLEDDGFTIMRVRQMPLKAITNIDVISKTPFNPKVVTNDILTHIMDAYTLDARMIKKIKAYLVKEDIQNEKGLDAYIDMILTEKGQKK